jgi:hypothetical protein
MKSGTGANHAIMGGAHSPGHAVPMATDAEAGLTLSRAIAKPIAYQKCLATIAAQLAGP